MTTNYPTLDSNNLQPEQNSNAFLLLDEKVQKWIWLQDWKDLHEIQEKSIRPVLSCDTDIILSSPTASGKTEAAFLPIFSKLMKNRVKGIQTIYISPLKALINDQFERLYSLSEQLEIPVFKWHGDVSHNYKKKLLENPQGILQITPESLESLFINHSSQCSQLFKPLLYVVIDELHYFIGSERGKQLQSLMNRMELILNRIIPRIGLSATIGDITLAQKYLRPDNKFPIIYISSEGAQGETKLQIKGYLIKEGINVNTNSSKVDFEEYTAEQICYHLFNNLRGKNNLIFANSRANVEKYTDLLNRISEKNNLPIEFYPHHGNLSKQIREDVESKIKNKIVPSSAVCTSTLELGIDIGSVHSIAQIGVPPSVSSLRQRLGRSGRRGEPAILRIYIQEEEFNEGSTIQDQLRAELFQTVATIELLKRKWYEPPIIGQLHFSTLLQQILALIAQYGGVSTKNLWEILIEKGPFNIIPKNLFLLLLKDMGKNDLISQTSDGLILLGLNGERLVNKYSFYSVFITPEEYRLLTKDTFLGTLPIDFPVYKGLFIIFAGKRWEIVEVSEEKKIIELQPAFGGKPPKFFGGNGMIQDEIRQEMFKIYSSKYIPIYLDDTAKIMYKEGLENFIRYRLKENVILQDGKDTLLFIWYGDRVINTIMLLFQYGNIQVSREGICIKLFGKNNSEVKEYLKNIIQNKTITEYKIAKPTNNKKQQKYDFLLSDDLLTYEYSSRYIDLPKTRDIIMNTIFQ